METPKPGTLKNVIFSNIVAAGAQQTCPIAGIPNHPIEHITLDNIRFTFAGGGKKEHIDVQVPELISEYPEAEMFGTLPAYGFYCRHVTDLKLQDISLAVSTPDLRHVLVCEDVNKLVVDSFDAEFSQGAAAPLRFQVVTKALIRGCMPSAAMETFIQVPKSQQDEIHLIGNVGNLLK